MSVSRANKVAALSLAALVSLPAWAVDEIPMGPASMVNTDEELKPLPPRSSIVKSQELNTVSAESAGVLDQRQGGFPAAMWSGTPATLVRKLIPLLPAASTSAVVQKLERRLLLSSATAPEGADAARNGGPSLMELRAERLMAMGDVDGVATLGNAAPTITVGPMLSRLKLEAMLAAGNTEGACAEAARGTAEGPDFARIQVFCTLASGKVAEGNMGLDLLRERKDPDSAFHFAAEVMGGLPPLGADKIQLAKAEPLHVAAFRAAKIALPAAAVTNAGPHLLKAIAQSTTATLDQRLAAAERAEILGLMDAEALRKLYAQAEFKPEELAAAIPAADAGGPRARALLYRAATAISDDGMRAQIIGKVLDVANAKGDLPSAARIFAPLIGEIRPAPENAGIAAIVARALYATNRPEAADKWADVARTGPDAHAAARLWPYHALHGGQQGFPTAAYAAWKATQQGVPADLLARRSALVLGMLAGLGAQIPDVAWADALELPNASLRPGLFALMQGGALGARTGITVLAALTSIGDMPLSKADTIPLSEAVSALAVVGLTDDARALAVEILMANGV